MIEDTFNHPGRKDEVRKDYVPGKVKLEDALSKIEAILKGTKTKKIRDRRGEITVEGSVKDLVLLELKRLGYDHFVALSCIDQLEDNKFDLVYHLCSYGVGALVMVKTNVDRDAPSIGSVVEIFRPAITYEREIHEMFGVSFPGNPRLTQFILEDWEGPPPMRKDFDSISYSQETYGVKVRYEKGLPPGLGKKEVDR